MHDFGIYIHVPFCETKCNYCSFVTRPWRADMAERYWRAVVAELEVFFGKEGMRGRAETIYFGGGTPSLVPESHISEIVAACRRLVDVAPRAEITLEANPEDVSERKADSYLELGITRVSLGAESFEDCELAALGRVHDADRTARALEILRARGFTNCSLDLMAGLPGQNDVSWAASLARVTELGPEHVSVYMLELEPKAPLLYLVERGQVRLPDDDTVADWYLEMRAHLARYGYAQYEISNFARPGWESRHNMKYWRREPVLGFGVGSHSFDGTARYANVARLETYLEAVENGRTPVEWRREIGDREALEETFFLGLRLGSGVDWDDVARSRPADRLAPYAETLLQLESAGLVEREASRLRLTPRGMLLSNEVFQQFL